MYEVLETFPGFELRLYPAHVVAEIDVDASFEGAGNQGFRPLVSYISGNNTSRTKVAMTAPVVQEQRGSEKIAMTAPVVQEASSQAGRYVVGFVLPHTYSLETAPIPSDSRVRVREVPAHRAVVLRFTGRWTTKSYDEKVEQLRRFASDHGYEITGPLQFARFDPPWTPWFMRRNEIVAPIAG